MLRILCTKNVSVIFRPTDNYLNPVYTVQPVVKLVVQPVWQPAVSCNRFDNRLCGVNKHPTGCLTGCQTSLTTGWMFVYMIQLVVKPVVKRIWQPVWQPCWTNSTVRSTRLQQHGLTNTFDNQLNVCIHDTTGCQTDLTTGLTTGWEPVVSCIQTFSRLSNRFHNRFDNQVVSCKRGFTHNAIFCPPV